MKPEKLMKRLLFFSSYDELESVIGINETMMGGSKAQLYIIECDNWLEGIAVR